LLSGIPFSKNYINLPLILIRLLPPRGSNFALIILISSQLKTTLWKNYQKMPDAQTIVAQTDHALVVAIVPA
jgi:hypothetical protein